MLESPQDDNGYDISDYRRIYKEYGTMEDYEELFVRSSQRDIRILMDLVVNHTLLMNITGSLRAANPKTIRTVTIISGKILSMERNQTTGAVYLAVLHGNMMHRPRCITCICSQRNSRISTGKTRKYARKFMI